MRKMKLFGKKMIVLLAATMFLFGCGSKEETSADSETVQDLVIEEQVEETEVQEEAEEEAEQQEAEQQEADKSEEADEQKEEQQTTDKYTTSVEKMIKDAEKEAAVLEKKLAEDETLSQADMNELSNEIYVIWDDVLNELWAILKETLQDDVMGDLLEEQREWITYKEAEAKKAGEEFAGGSMETMVVNQKAAELTKERVYELAQYYQ